MAVHLLTASPKLYFSSLIHSVLIIYGRIWKLCDVAENQPGRSKISRVADSTQLPPALHLLSLGVHMDALGRRLERRIENIF